MRSGRGVVHDIGTQFQVARYGGDVTVTLLSGLVSVALAEPASPQENRVLAPGEELHIGDRGDLGWPTRVDLDVVSGWTRGVLTFKDRRLGDLLDEMNRYSETKIRIADPALSSLVVSGVFRTGDQSSLLRAARRLVDPFEARLRSRNRAVARVAASARACRRPPRLCTAVGRTGR